MKDPIVEEVREARRKHAKQFNFDLHSICLDLKKKEKACENPIKSLPPKLLKLAVDLSPRVPPARESPAE